MAGLAIGLQDWFDILVECDFRGFRGHQDRRHGQEGDKWNERHSGWESHCLVLWTYSDIVETSPTIKFYTNTGRPGWYGACYVNNKRDGKIRSRRGHSTGNDGPHLHVSKYRPLLPREIGVRVNYSFQASRIESKEEFGMNILKRMTVFAAAVLLAAIDLSRQEEVIIIRGEVNAGRWLTPVAD